MVNQFGNYLCQRIMEEADSEDMEKIVETIQYDLVTVSLNIHGTRVIQILIERLSRGILDNIQRNEHLILQAETSSSCNECIPFEQIKGFQFSQEHTRNHAVLLRVIDCLNQSVIDLIMDMHGNHVIQAFLIQFKAADKPQYGDIAGAKQTSKYTDFIFDACILECVPIGMHKHGCCVMQRCLEKGSRAQKLRLSNYIIDNLHHLIEDPYGNYLVQNVLKLEDRDKNEQIFRQIAKDFIRLSQLKFSSNVIEKCLDSKMSWSAEVHPS